MKKILAMALALLMIVSVLPLSVVAAENDLNLGFGGCDYYNVIEKNDYNLAPGAVESEIVINDDEGNRRQVVHVIEVDPNNENVSVMPSFKNISNDVDYTDQSNWGIMEMSKQAAYAEETLGKNVVGAMNVCLSWAFNHPYGLLLYEGEVLCDNRASCEYCGNGHPGKGYLVIYKDGRAELRDPFAPLTGEEWMAQTVCFDFLVKDGVSLNKSENHSSDPAPRSVIGVKADGTLVLMMVDGRMAPYSTGFNSHEMAQMMLDLGCVDAINCDGGGSSTFITEREGTGELSVKSRFSDGAERATLTGILVISNAVADGKFDHAVIEADNKLVTPGSTVNFKATGADSSGGPAEIPSDISWALKDTSMGTIDNGVFVSNGKAGEVVAQMLYAGEVVGEATIEVVIPDTLSFIMSNITAPYTKTVSLDVVAKYGYSEVTLKSGDVEFVLSDNAIGTIVDGKLIATGDESVVGGTVTATLTCNSAASSTANIILGKGSEIVYDFESGEESIANWKLAYKGVYTPDKYYFYDGLSVASVEDGGKVRNGKYALKVTSDGDSITCMNWCQTKIQGMNIDLTDAVSLSFWIYIPEGSHGLEWDIGSAIPVVLGHEFEYGTGWQYLTVNVSDIGTNVTRLNEVRLYHSDTNNGGNGYNHYEHPNYYADVVYYIDDITVNYSSAVDDNDAPKISNACVSYDNIDVPVAMVGQDINSNVVAFTANVTDNHGNTNFTGVDTESLVVYVDGKPVSATCSEDGRISTNDVVLANGVHTVVFDIADNKGNVNMYKEYTINIVGDESKNTIKYVPAVPTLKDVLNDSIVWMNLVATSIDTVDTIKTTIDLDQNSKWQLDHMVLAEGFTASYTIDAENNDATIVITKTGSVKLAGEAVVASFPIRVWAPAFIKDGGNEDSHSYRLVSVMSYVQYGELIETDAAVSTFASDMQVISTEWNSTRLTSVVDKESWHIHTEEPIADCDAGCTTNGYTNRTFCAVCNSVVDWGTTVSANGHDFTIDGTCKYCDEVSSQNGLTEIDGEWYFLFNGVAQSGWQSVGSDWYYFDKTTKAAVSGSVKINGLYFDFEENGRLISGVWGNVFTGWRYFYGPGYYIRGWYNIDGKDYYFKNGYRCVGYDYQKGSGMPDIWYDFGEDGADPIKLNGIYNIDGSLRYFEDGLASEKHLFELNGDYYYSVYGGYIVTNKTVNIASTNCELPKGVYTFGEDGKMIGASADGEIVLIDGVAYYYENGVGVSKGLVKVGEDYYYTTYGGKIATNVAVSVNTTSCDLAKGRYEFGADGKMLQGIIEKDGELYYYENGNGVQKGLFEYEGDYYYSAYLGKLAVAKTIDAVFTSCDLAKGRYEFGADGKMLQGIVEKDGELYYYENGNGVKKGLFEYEGDYYYSAYLGKLAVAKTIDAVSTSCDLAKGRYEFGADGKMLQGIVEKDGELYYYENGNGVNKGLFEYEGDYYYSAYLGKLAVAKTIDAVSTSCDLAKGRYEFGADGKMLQGIVEKDGELYYYENGNGVEKGLFMLDEFYYYSVYGGKLAVNKDVHIIKGNGLLVEKTYTFDETGKIVK